VGVVNGMRVDRNKLFLFVASRNVIKVMAEGLKEGVDPKVLQKKVHVSQKEALIHVNRIYRGSPGGEYSGVFTKDHVYFKGMIEMSRYIAEKIGQGADMGQLFDYLMQGKFNPLDNVQVDYLEGLQSE
jgi:hypothetical protein